MRLRFAIFLPLLFWFSRIHLLDVFPLHNDEGLHLTRALEVWNLHPFWQINDGKIINHWLIATFYPQNAPIFTGRIATVFVAMLGCAAGIALARRWFGSTAALFAGALWIASNYLFFFERLALSDAEAGALVVLAVWAALRQTRTRRRRAAVLTGLALAAAALFKFTALPFAFTVVLIVLALKPAAWRARLVALLIIGGVVLACFAVPTAYLLLRGDDLFGIAFNWIGGGSYGSERGAAANLARLWQQLTQFYSPLWGLALLAGLAGLLWRGRMGVVLLAGALVPLLAMIVFGTEVMPRHYVAALPLLLTLGGVGLAGLIERLPGLRRPALVALLALLAVGHLPFALQAYSAPDALNTPPQVRLEYMDGHSAGFGLREAVQAFPQTLARADLPIIGSMFPDGCRRANYYADAIRMQCAAAPGIPEIEAALAQYGAVYVLTDEAPNIGVDAAALAGQATRLAVYPRPDEDDSTASVVLWLIELE